MAQNESNNNVLDYLNSAAKSIGEAESAAKSLNDWHLPNLPGVYTPRQDTYNENVRPDRDKAYEDMDKALKAPVPEGKREEAETLYGKNLNRLIALDQGLKQSSSSSFYYWAPFEVTSEKYPKNLPVLPDHLGDKQSAPTQTQTTPPNVPALARNLRFKRGEFNLHRFYNAAEKDSYRQADITAAQRLEALKGDGLMSNLQKESGKPAGLQRCDRMEGTGRNPRKTTCC
jgi:hypothetical protein